MENRISSDPLARITLILSSWMPAESDTELLSLKELSQSPPLTTDSIYEARASKMGPQSADMIRQLRLDDTSLTTLGDSFDLAGAAKKPHASSAPGNEGGSGGDREVAKPQEDNVCRSIALGQMLSALIALMSMSSASLVDRGVSLPCFVNCLNYAILMFFFFIMPKLWGRCEGFSRPRVPFSRYLVYALVDVEANMLSVLAFRYTSITSVTMLDAFSIPSVMVLSCCFLGAIYTRRHLAGVALCLVGLGLTVASDLQDDNPDSGHGHALKGDFLCILGAAMYAVSNVMQEHFVKKHDRGEFLGMAGLCGFVISGVQTIIFEREAIMAVEWTQPVVLFIMGYAVSLSIMYMWTSLFLKVGDAALYNLSLLTSDVYALLFAFFVENATPNALYFLAFVIIFCGLVLYHVQPAPTQLETTEVVNGLSSAPSCCVPVSSAFDRCFLRLPKLVPVRECSGVTANTYMGSEFSDIEDLPSSPRDDDISFL